MVRPVRWQSKLNSAVGKFFVVALSVATLSIGVDVAAASATGSTTGATGVTGSGYPAISGTVTNLGENAPWTGTSLDFVTSNVAGYQVGDLVDLTDQGSGSSQYYVGVIAEINPSGGGYDLVITGLSNAVSYTHLTLPTIYSV